MKSLSHLQLKDKYMHKSNVYQVGMNSVKLLTAEIRDYLLKK